MGSGRAQKMSRIADRIPLLMQKAHYLMPAFRRLAAQSSFGYFIRFPLCVDPSFDRVLPNPPLFHLSQFISGTLPSASQPSNPLCQPAKTPCPPPTNNNTQVHLQGRASSNLTAHHSTSSNPIHSASKKPVTLYNAFRQTINLHPALLPLLTLKMDEMEDSYRGLPQLLSNTPNYVYNRKLSQYGQLS